MTTGRMQEVALYDGQIVFRESSIISSILVVNPFISESMVVLCPTKRQDQMDGSKSMPFLPGRYEKETHTHDES